MNVWLLTSEYNAYDQLGEYFEAIFQDKPTGNDLCRNGITSEADQEHILKGGGRRGSEAVWYNLREERLQ
jgi:nitric oxide reductase large subunit